ncbi:MAG: hypothetical protein R2764_07155 [Bacteroidales bacterium]
MYAVDVIHIKLINGDDVFLDTNYKGDIAIRAHIQNVWGIGIYNR